MMLWAFLSVFLSIAKSGKSLREQTLPFSAGSFCRSDRLLRMTKFARTVFVRSTHNCLFGSHLAFPSPITGSRLHGREARPTGPPARRAGSGESAATCLEIHNIVVYQVCSSYLFFILYVSRYMFPIFHAYSCSPFAPCAHTAVEFGGRAFPDRNR
jgi:hypothetical protein